MATISRLYLDHQTMQQIAPRCLQVDRICLWRHDLWDLRVAGIVLLGVVGLEDGVEWWD